VLVGAGLPVMGERVVVDEEVVIVAVEGVPVCASDAVAVVSEREPCVPSVSVWEGSSSEVAVITTGV